MDKVEISITATATEVTTVFVVDGKEIARRTSIRTETGCRGTERGDLHTDLEDAGFVTLAEFADDRLSFMPLDLLQAIEEAA